MKKSHKKQPSVLTKKKDLFEKEYGKSRNDGKVWTRDQVLLLHEKFLDGMSETAIAQMVGHPRDGANRLRKLIGGNSALDRSLHSYLRDQLDECERGYARTDLPWTQADTDIFRNWKKQRDDQIAEKPSSYTRVEMTEDLLCALLRRDEDCRVLNKVLYAKETVPGFDIEKEQEAATCGKCETDKLLSALLEIVLFAHDKLSDLYEEGESDD